MTVPSPASCLRRLRLLTAGAALALAVAPAAAQAVPSTETITTTWLRSGASDTPPHRGTGSGTFTASGVVNDAGTVSITGMDTSFPSPVAGAAQLDMVFTSPDGVLELRCPVAPMGTFIPPADVLVHGSCTIISASGVYAGLHGHGDFTGVVDFTVPPAGQVTQNIVLRVT
jgi:hypothetical protein